MKKIGAKLFILMLWSVFLVTSAYGEIILIGSPGIKVDSLTPKQVKQLYLSRISSLDGIEVKLADSSEIQKEFLTTYIGKSVRAYNKSWIKKIFAEGATPPVIFKNNAEVIDFVKKSENAIGYVSSKPSGVKILLKK